MRLGDQDRPFTGDVLVLRLEGEEYVIQRSEHSRYKHSVCKGPGVGMSLAYQATERSSVWVGLREQGGEWEEMRSERQEA